MSEYIFRYAVNLVMSERSHFDKKEKNVTNIVNLN